ncbi:MAG: hypothetical protein GY822_04005 [Deltaproteobacteria bacterium]|nr:hypothetical protein [Deltaproteobacteria bacterium]
MPLFGVVFASGCVLEARDDDAGQAGPSEAELDDAGLEDLKPAVFCGEVLQGPALNNAVEFDEGYLDDGR